MLEYKHPDLAIVDVGLPDGSGLDLLRRVREADGVASRLDPRLAGAGAHRPRRRSSTGCAGSSAGPTTSWPSPSPTASCGCRLGGAAAPHARARRGARPRCGSATCEIDPLVARGPRCAARRVALSQKEFALLRALATEPTRVFTKEELLRDVWGFRSMGATRTLDSHACRLRHKLGRRRRPLRGQRVGRRLPAVDGPVCPA